MAKSSAEVVAIIPARGGSKGIRRKNIVELGGLPLVAWAIKVAAAAKKVTRVVVSTDDPEIADISRQFGAEVPYLRPAELATDCAPLTGVVASMMELLKAEGYVPDCELMLYPTHPFRTPALLDEVTRLCMEECFRVTCCSSCSWNSSFFFAQHGRSWRQLPLGLSGAATFPSGIIAGSSREDDAFLQASDRMERARVVARLIQAGDRRYETRLRYLPLASPTMLLDIDTDEDLQEARRLVAARAIPWHPIEGYGSASETEQTFLFNQTVPYPALSSILVYQADDKAQTPRMLGSVSLTELPRGPVQLLSLLRSQFPDLASSFLTTAPGEDLPLPPDRLQPTLWLNPRTQLPMNISRIFQEVWVGKFFRDPELARTFASARASVSLQVQGNRATVRFPEEIRKGDRAQFIIRTQDDRTFEELREFDGRSWNLCAPLGHPPTAEPLLLQGSAHEIHYTTGTDEPLSFRLLRPGFNDPNAACKVEPIDVPEILVYDKHDRIRRNVLTGEAIRGRQQMPAVMAWSGQAFLPATLAPDSEWTVVRP